MKLFFVQKVWYGYLHSVNFKPISKYVLNTIGKGAPKKFNTKEIFSSKYLRKAVLYQKLLHVCRNIIQGASGFENIYW